MSTEIGTLLVSSPDVCGGRLRVDGTRITINQIASLYKQGSTAEEIADQYVRGLSPIVRLPQWLCAAALI